MPARRSLEQPHDLIDKALVEVEGRDFDQEIGDEHDDGDPEGAAEIPPTEMEVAHRHQHHEQEGDRQQ